jgi:transcriptional regulator with XRE-family HTH domain
MDINPLEIKRLREQKGMSLNELARKAGMSTNTVFRIEGGKASREKTIKKIADALAVDVHTLNKGYVQKGGESADKFDDVAQKAQKIGAASFFEIDTGTDPFGQAVSDLREIFNSGDQVIITAILANLFTFKRATRREQEIATLKSENQVLQREMESLKSRLTALEEKVKGG